VSLDGPFLSYAAARWLGYLAAFLLIGVAGYGRVLRRTSAFESWPPPLVRLARGAAVLLAISLLARSYLQCRTLLEPEDPLTLEFVVAVLQSTWGRGWLAQGTAGIVALVVWRSIGKRPSRLALPALAAAAVAAAAPWTGHAVGLAEAPRWAPLADLVHFGAAAAWLGGLATMVTLFRDPSRRALDLVEAFSPLALRAGVLAMAAGALLSVSYLGGIGHLDRLVTTEYGRALTLKLLAIGLVAALGGYNWRVVLPALRSGHSAPIRRTAYAELCAGALVLAITAILVSLPAPGELAE